MTVFCLVASWVLGLAGVKAYEVVVWSAAMKAFSLVAL